MAAARPSATVPASVPGGLTYPQKRGLSLRRDSRVRAVRSRRSAVIGSACHGSGPVNSRVNPANRRRGGRIGAVRRVARQRRRTPAASRSSAAVSAGLVSSGRVEDTRPGRAWRLVLRAWRPAMSRRFCHGLTAEGIERMQVVKRPTLKEVTMSDQIRRADYYYTHIPDKPGEAFRILHALHEANVNLLGFSAFPSPGKGAQVDIVPDGREPFLAACKKAGLTLVGPKTCFLV